MSRLKLLISRFLGDSWKIMTNLRQTSRKVKFSNLILIKLSKISKNNDCICSRLLRVELFNITLC